MLPRKSNYSYFHLVTSYHCGGEYRVITVLDFLRRHPMKAKNAKQKTNRQLRNTFKKKKRVPEKTENSSNNVFHTDYLQLYIEIDYRF